MFAKRNYYRTAFTKKDYGFTRTTWSRKKLNRPYALLSDGVWLFCIVIRRQFALSIGQVVTKVKSP